MYWLDVGTSVATMYRHTYEFNLLYERPIDPLGQLFDSPPTAQIERFRAAANAYHAKGVAWWDWQSAGAAQFRAISQRAGATRGTSADLQVASLGRGAVGDVVVWAQEHLVAAGSRIAIDGIFGPQTQRAVEHFQREHDMRPSGVLTPATWALLLRLAPVAVKWTYSGGSLSATVTTTKHTQTRLDGDGLAVKTLEAPASAKLPAREDELRGSPGEGYPRAGLR
jgi:hypothetical protein